MPSLGEDTLRAVFDDWPLNPIVKAYLPTPFNPNKTGDDTFGNVLRPNQAPGVHPVIEDSSLPGSERFNPDTFAHHDRSRKPRTQQLL